MPRIKTGPVQIIRAIRNPRLRFSRPIEAARGGLPCNLSRLELTVMNIAAPLYFAMAGLLVPSVRAENWPQFRGMQSAGVAAPGARPPVKIGSAENVKWKIDVPWSPASPCVWGDRIFLTTFAEPNLGLSPKGSG